MTALFSENRKETEQMKLKHAELNNVSSKMEEEHKLNLEKDSKMALLRQKFPVGCLFFFFVFFFVLCLFLLFFFLFFFAYKWE